MRTAGFLYGEEAEEVSFGDEEKKAETDASRTEMTLQSSYQTTVKVLHGLQLLFSHPHPPVLLPWSGVIGNLVFV